MPYNIGYRTVYYIGEPEHEELTGLKTTTGGPVKYADVIANHNSSDKFEDPDFPANDTSLDVDNFCLDAAKLGLNLDNWDRSIRWARPAEAIKLVYDFWDEATSIYQVTNTGETVKKSRFDVQQGKLGNCWFIVGVSQITLAPELIELVAPNDNEQNNDSGAYHFRMWKYGVCTDVVIDDLLPLYEPRGPNNGYKFIMCAPKVANAAGNFEFWPCFVEKAYAKLNGNYSRLAAGSPRYALEDLTGGISEHIPLTYEVLSSEDYFGLLKNLKDILFVNFTTDGEDTEGILTGKNAEEGKSFGLARPHAYAMTKVATINYEGEDVKLVCIRNPWGSGEWTGPWNENSEEWKSISEEDKKAAGLVINDDGEFWMAWFHVQTYFAQMEMCYWFPESYIESMKHVYAIQQHHSKWNEADGTNGGVGDLSHNPQYVVNVNVDNGAIIACLEGKAEINNRNIGVDISCYKVGDPNSYDLTKRLGKDFFENPLNEERKTYEEKLDILGDLELRVGKSWKVPAGTYILVPTVTNSQVADGRCELGFVLRIAGQISDQTLQIHGQRTVVVAPPPKPITAQ